MTDCIYKVPTSLAGVPVNVTNSTRVWDNFLPLIGSQPTLSTVNQWYTLLSLSGEGEFASGLGFWFGGGSLDCNTEYRITIDGSQVWSYSTSSSYPQVSLFMPRADSEATWSPSRVMYFTSTFLCEARRTSGTSTPTMSLYGRYLLY